MMNLTVERTHIIMHERVVLNLKRASCLECYLNETDIQELYKNTVHGDVCKFRGYRCPM
jgi:hypothetical protein